jgi:hypothetical protein
MDSVVLVIVLMVASALPVSGLRPKPRAVTGPKPFTSSSTPSKVDFDTQLKPIFAARCQPCHFSGGKVYATMPFDRPETIKRLGTKLFTRIKDEKEQQLIRQFLSQE